MKIFISHKYSGEDPEDFGRSISRIRAILEEKGHSIFCTYWKEDYYRANKFTKMQILDHFLAELKESDVCLAYVRSPQPSEGMLLELGYALAMDKRIVVAIKEGVEYSFITGMAHQLINYDTADELFDKLEAVQFE